MDAQNIPNALTIHNDIFEMSDDIIEVPIVPQPTPVFHFPPVPVGRSSSEIQYRFLSDNIREIEHTASIEYSQTYGVTFEQAQQRLQLDPWNQYPLDPVALLVGQTITATEIPQTLTNSPIPNGVYLDTFVVIMLNGVMVGFCTFTRHQNSIEMNFKHSGDILIGDWLRHVIDLPSNENIQIYVCTAGWKDGYAYPLIDFAELDPILEVRSRTGDLKTRQIISTGFAEAGLHTAMINSKIRFEDGGWKCTIMREFCMGYVGDLNPVVEKIVSL